MDLNPIGWSRDGRSVFAMEVQPGGSQIVRAPAEGGRAEPWLDLSELGVPLEAEAIPDGRIVAIISSETSDIFMLPALVPVAPVAR